MVEPRRTEKDNYKNLGREEVIVRKGGGGRKIKTIQTTTKAKLPPQMNLQTKSIIRYQTEHNPCRKYSNNRDVGQVIQKRWNLNHTCRKRLWKSRKGRGIL